MKRQFQKHGRDGVPGDCHRTCIAMVLNMDRDAVPHFMADVPYGTPPEDPIAMRSEQAELDWLAQFNLSRIYIPFEGSMSLEYFLEQHGRFSADAPVILGCSISEDTNHSVVIYRGEIFDPAGAFALECYKPNLQGFWWLTIFAPSGQWQPTFCVTLTDEHLVHGTAAR